MDQQALVAALHEHHAHHAALIDRLSPEAIVYADAGWRVKDIIAHVTHWEEQTLLTIEHGLRGERYYLPNFRELGADGFNAHDYERRKDASTADILRQWDAMRNDTVACISQLTPEQWAAPMRWFGSDTTIEQLVSGTLWHEQHHMSELKPLLAVS